MNKQPLSEADRSWIKSLHCLEDSGHRTVMTEGDESRLTFLIRDHSLPCLMCRFKQGFGIQIFDNPRAPGEDPEPLACISGYLKLPKRGTEYVEAEYARYIAHHITHTPENAEILARFGFKALNSDPISYCY